MSEEGTVIEVPFRWAPRNYQEGTWNHFENTPVGARGVAVWHRRAGKDLFGINLCATKMAERPGLYWHLFPTYNQGRKIAWDGFTKTGRPFLDHFPPDLVESKNGTDMRVTLKTGGIYQVVGTEDPDRLVGANPVGCIFSEYSLQDPRAWDIIRPILAENDGWALFIYTARGKNHGYKLLETAKKIIAKDRLEGKTSKWHAEVLIAGSGEGCTKRRDGTPVISDQVIQDERDAGMPEELIAQEFKCSFEAPIVGAYYAKQMTDMLDQKRIGKVPWDPHLPVNTQWDLGIGDSCAIIFTQSYGMEERVIDYYEQSGEGLPHYAKYLGEKPYVYGQHNAPWDIDVRELGTGKTRLEVARGLGIRFNVGKQIGVDDGIENVRGLLPLVWIDEEKCERLLEALRQYQKEWDEKNKIYKNKPLHNWTSHGADAMRTWANSRRRKSKWGKEAPQDRADSEYDVHAQ